MFEPEFLLLLLLAFIALVFLRKRFFQNQKPKEWQGRWLKERLEWNKKVNRAKQHLKGADWRDPAGKLEFITELYGNDIPDYLCYEVKRPLTEEEVREIVDFYWDGEPNPEGIETRQNLGIRNPRRFTPMLLDEFPLIQVGYIPWWESIDEHGFPDKTVLFSAEGFYQERL